MKILWILLTALIALPLKSDVLKIGMELNYPPFEMTKTNGEPDGISVGIAKALAAKLRKELKIENMAFDGLIPALKTGSIDLVISSLTVNEDRKKSIDFSTPYVNTGLALLLAKGSSVIDAGGLDRKDLRVAVKKGTTGQAWAAKNLKSATVLSFDKENTAVLEVLQGKADAFIYDQMSIYHHWKKNPAQTKAVLKAFQSESWAIGVRKGRPELLKQVNAFIEEYRKAGGFDKLADQYLGEEKKVFKSLGVDFIL